MSSLLFLRQWLRAPASVASVAPSGRQLASLMAAQVPPGPGWVLELGPGTGAITHALVRAGLARHLWALELDPRLAAHLAHGFPGVRVAVGDARQLPALVPDGPVRAVVSSLPLRAMPARVVGQVSEAIAQVLPAGAPWIQYTYRPGNPLPGPVRDLWEGQRVGLAWANLPPARVWAFTRSG